VAPPPLLGVLVLEVSPHLGSKFSLSLTVGYEQVLTHGYLLFHPFGAMSKLNLHTHSGQKQITFNSKVIPLCLTPAATDISLITKTSFNLFYKKKRPYCYGRF